MTGYQRDSFIPTPLPLGPVVGPRCSPFIVVCRSAFQLVKGNVWIEGNNALTMVDIRRLESVEGNMVISSNAALDKVNAKNLVVVAGSV